MEPHHGPAVQAGRERAMTLHLSPGIQRQTAAQVLTRRALMALGGAFLLAVIMLGTIYLLSYTGYGV
jgi:hypothetical protein